MVSRRKKGLAVIAALAVLAGIAFSVWLVQTRGGPWGDRPERTEAHDRVTAWLTCHHFLQDSVPGVNMVASPWRAAEESVRRVDATTYWAVGTVPLRGAEAGAEEGLEARFDCVLEWRRAGWRLESLDVTVVTARPLDSS